MEYWWLMVAVGAAGGWIAASWYSRRPQRKPRGSTVSAQSRDVIGALPFGALIAHDDGRVAFANGRARDLGMVTSIATLPEPLNNLAAVVSASGSPRDDRVELTRGLRGTEVEIFALGAPLADDLVLISGHDDSSTFASEAARREFAVNVSHELKTPIGALALMVEAMAGAADNPDQVRDFAVRMEREVARVSALVQQTIHLSRVQASATVIEPRSVDLAIAVDDAIAAVHQLAKTRGVAVTDSVESVTVQGDHELLVMALRNLIENAVQYSRPNSRVVVESRRSDHSVSVVVMDSGIGISEEDQKRVFERFFRADQARSREKGGTGLGLSIVKHIVRQHGGDATMWSQPGVGTTVTITLPVT